jgi:putative spermidine/putrescine transport system substrate-binding protein
MKKLAYIVLCLTVGISMVGCGSKAAEGTTQGSAKSESKELVVVDWGGNYTDVRKKATYEPFEKKYGVKVTIVSPTDYGKLKAMVSSGNVEWDVVNVDADFVVRGGKEGLLEKLDYNVIKTDGVDKKYIFDYGIESETFDVAISYNTKTFADGKQPKSWAEFWDTTKFPGARSMQKFPEGTLEAALLADGVAPDKLFPLDVDRAFNSLDKIKKDVKVWWTTGAQPPQMLATGEVTTAAAWSGRVLAAKKQGSPEDVEYNQALAYGDAWVVPKGAKNKELAMKFIDYATTAEAQAEFSKLVDYAPTNSKAVDLLPDDVKKRIGLTADSSNKKIVADVNWWAENYDKVNERFEKWLLK